MYHRFWYSIPIFMYMDSHLFIRILFDKKNWGLVRDHTKHLINVYLRQINMLYSQFLNK